MDLLTPFYFIIIKYFIKIKFISILKILFGLVLLDSCLFILKITI